MLDTVSFFMARRARHQGGCELMQTVRRATQQPIEALDNQTGVRLVARQIYALGEAKEHCDNKTQNEPPMEQSDGHDTCRF